MNKEESSTICYELTFNNTLTLSVSVDRECPGVIDVAMVVDEESCPLGAVEMEYVSHPELMAAVRDISEEAETVFPSWAAVHELVVIPLVDGPRIVAEA